MKRLNLFVILAMLLSGCAAPGPLDWCYVFDFKTSSYGAVLASVTWIEGEGFRPGTTATTSITIDTVTASPDYYAISGRADWVGEKNIRVNGSTLFGTSYLRNTNLIPGGEFTYYLEGNTANSGNQIVLVSTANGGDTNIYLGSLTVYGNGTNPFPDNDCEVATPTPEATAGAPSLDIPTDEAITQLNNWFVVLGPVFGLMLIPAALLLIRVVLRWFRLV